MVIRGLVTGLWLAALFLVGLLIFYLPGFHHPAPHHVTIAVAASLTATAGLRLAASDRPAARWPGRPQRNHLNGTTPSHPVRAQAGIQGTITP